VRALIELSRVRSHRSEPKDSAPRRSLGTRQYQRVPRSPRSPGRGRASPKGRGKGTSGAPNLIRSIAVLVVLASTPAWLPVAFDGGRARSGRARSSSDRRPDRAAWAAARGAGRRRTRTADGRPRDLAPPGRLSPSLIRSSKAARSLENCHRPPLIGVRPEIERHGIGLHSLGP
jgi:hypothetical protein